VDDWCRAQQVTRGASLTVGQVWSLSQAWYADRLSPDFRGRSLAEAQAIFAAQGLVGPFWAMDEAVQPAP
jgi:hypothetical protein